MRLIAGRSDGGWPMPNAGAWLGAGSARAAFNAFVDQTPRTTGRFETLPTSLRQRARLMTLAGVPSLVVHPDWARPAPLVVWMHGRTADKELDPGRYLRWMRAGIGACAVDLPGHGERTLAHGSSPAGSLRVLRQMVGEVDGVLAELDATHPWLFDRSRLGIGGMSLGGMAALRRLCDPHRFVCAAVESTTGWLEELYHPTIGVGERVEGSDPAASMDGVAHDRAAIAPLDPMGHVGGFAPIPLLVLHSEADQMVAWQGQRAFVERLRGVYAARGADPGLIEVRTWATTGAPREHIGFGTVAAEAKELQTAFLRRVLIDGGGA